ncbi:hypothetical protein DZF91_13855 [Actinomadura logoneensis]|uniref:Uncharacterized protein n=1 Tax=Actinomadura logoneensis TaxID=2293572 RepID=A0A372JM01_9ACTN|nr:hypothetical protein [Actinomadura logoneensis]RFU41052.1 hypothetical protein DZF91_13855 [Actinomadura logoneensis]
MGDPLAELAERLVSAGLCVKPHPGPLPDETVVALLVTHPAMPSVGESVRWDGGYVDSTGRRLGDDPVGELRGRLSSAEAVAARWRAVPRA